jgi:hypothetical protein
LIIDANKIQLVTDYGLSNHPPRHNWKDKHSDYYNLNLTNERLFLMEIIKGIYDSLEGIHSSTNNEIFFRDSQDFLTVVSDIHKDLTWLIRQNMIDANGNIAPQYTTSLNQYGVSNKTYLRGGYSIGCEIVKINLTNLSYIY